MCGNYALNCLAPALSEGLHKAASMNATLEHVPGLGADDVHVERNQDAGDE
jgi:hypothetical protein